MMVVLLYKFPYTDLSVNHHIHEDIHIHTYIYVHICTKAYVLVNMYRLPAERLYWLRICSCLDSFRKRRRLSERHQTHRGKKLPIASTGSLAHRRSQSSCTAHKNLMRAQAFTMHFLWAISGLYRIFMAGLAYEPHSCPWII